MTEERGGPPKGMAAVMARFRARAGIPQGEDTVPERWDCWKCGRFVDEPAGEKCPNPAWHGRRVESPSGYVLEKPGVNPNCGTCRGLGYLRRALNEPTDEGFGQVMACPDCLGPHMRGEQTRRMWEGIPRGLRNLTLKTFAEVGGDHDALTWTQEWLSKADPEIPWLVLYGPRGTGKTGLAVGVCHALSIERGLHAAFGTVPEILTRLRATYGPNNDESEDALLASLKVAEVLVLDDLGAQRSTAWAEEKLFEVINHRYNERLITNFTTNADPSDLAETSEQMGRIVDRMVQLACQVAVQHPNLRRQRPGSPASGT